MFESLSELKLRTGGCLCLALVLAWPAGRAAAQADQPGPQPTAPIVAGFERFARPANQPAEPSGRLLLGELICTSCHQVASAAAAGVLPKQAPVLDAIGARVKRSWLRRFLANPQAAKPGTTMPDVLAGVADSQKAELVESLVHFLAATGNVSQARPDRRLVSQGERVYHQVGCVACHAPLDAKAQVVGRLATSVPLGDLAAKYTIPSLISFLQDPHKARPAGRMPGLLKGDEPRDVAHYLLQDSAFEPQHATVNFTYYEGRGRPTRHRRRLSRAGPPRVRRQ
jgi:cytochrome c2